MKDAGLENLMKEIEALKSSSEKQDCPNCKSGTIEKDLSSTCCHSSNDNKVTNSCCETKAEKTTKCNCGEEELSSCCAPRRKTISNKPDGACSCSGKGESLEESGEEDGLSSCCAPKKKQVKVKETGTCGCDGGGVETCCGTVDLDKRARRKELIFLLVSLVSIVASYLLSSFMVYDKLGSHYYGFMDPAWIAIVISGYPLFVTAYQNIIKGKITSSLLVTMAMLASVTIGFLVMFGVGGAGHDHGGAYFFAAGEVAFIMAIGAYLENLTIAKSRSAIEKLISMKPSNARIKRQDGTYEEVNVTSVLVGDIVLVRPNETISVDGVVLSGESAIDYSNINGEYLPRESKQGDKVYAGTRNMSGALEITATKKSDETTLSKLIAYVKQAEKKKAPVVRIADKWASYLVVSSLIISILVFFITIFAFKLSIMEGVQRAATVLVVFCPCALALATPIAVAAGIGSASKKGLLIKSGSALEALAKIDTVAFDKTGTITEGKLKVEDVYAYGIDENELLKYAASAEAKSEHPLAKAIITKYNGQLLDSQNTISLVGKGVESMVEGKKVGVYKLELLKDIIPQVEYNNIPTGGRTVVGVTINGTYAGSIAISDTLRKNIAQVITELKYLGIKSVMLTGDSLEAANKVASEIGLDEIKASLLPEDKVSAIEELKLAGSKVLMIGDGVNDAAALASSNSSLAIGAMGSSVAMESAESSLLSDDMKKIPVLIRLSKRTLLTIKINITLSLIISFIAIVLSLFGYIDAVIGALVHNGSSTLVVMHAALLLLYKGNKKKSHKI